MSAGWSAVPEGPVPFDATPHLDEVSHRAAETARRLVEHADEALGASLRDDATVASLRLDGSPIRRPLDAAAPAPRPLVGGDRATAASWLEILARDDHGDERLTALEYRGLRRCIGDADLARALLVSPIEVLIELHRRITEGLVDPADQGRWRSRDLAVHDASGGQLLLRPIASERVPGRMDRLAAWMREHGRELPTTVVSGVVHLELLLIHPFASANGRLARTAARSVLQARSLDDPGIVPIEVVLLDDPIGYLREAAATPRRRDLTVWLERWSEVISEAGRRALRRAGVVAEPPERASAFVAERGPGPFTLVDYRDAVGVDLEETRQDLCSLLDAGLVHRVLASRGLRFLVP